MTNENNTPVITVANLFGRSITIENDGVDTVQDAVNYFYGGADKVPGNWKAKVRGADVGGDDQCRPGDVVIIREGEFATKRAVSGARC